jgi:tricorn protease
MRLRFLSPLVALVALGTPLAADINVRDTRLLHQPALSSTHVAFVYGDDLWVARIDGSDVRRLTRRSRRTGRRSRSARSTTATRTST